MFIATGRLAMWQGWVFICTARAVAPPPQPMGPMPKVFIFSSKARSIAAGPFWRKPYPYLIAFDNRNVNYRGGIVVGILSRKRVADRFSQIPAGVTLPHSLVYSILQRAVN